MLSCKPLYYTTILKIGFCFMRTSYYIVGIFGSMFVIYETYLLNFFFITTILCLARYMRVMCISWVACPRIYSVSFGLRERIDRVIPTLYYYRPDVQPTGLISSLNVRYSGRFSRQRRPSRHI